MKIAIIYESKTGNTKQIANSIKDYYEQDNSVIFESVDQAQSHPDREDLDNAKIFAREILELYN